MPQATPFDNILAQCRDLFCERLASALAGMLDKAGDALTGRENEARDADTQTLYREIRDKVLAQREKIETQFRARYLREFQLRSNRAKRIGDDFTDPDLSDVELALVGEDDLNETLKFNAMTARLRQYCEEELAALDQRIGVLFGDADLQSDDNPFAPQAISDAYKLTCAQVDDDVEVRLVLLKLFDEFVLDEIRGIYRALNALLVQNSILPRLRGMGVARKPRTKPPVPEAKGPEQDFFALLQNLVGKGSTGIPQPAPAATAPVQADPALAGIAPGGGLPGAGQVRVQGAELLRSLTRVQLGDGAGVMGDAALLTVAAAEPGTTNVLHELKTTSLGNGMSQMDAMTLDIVALLFDQLFDDPKIPIGVKGLIGRLQIPFLKVAIADKAFFSKKAHPARQMLDSLGEVAARLPVDVNASNPTFVRLDEILQGLMDRFEENVEIFDAVREQLEALVIEEDQRIEEQALADEKQVEQKESLALAKTVAQTEIKMRLRAARPPRAVIEFLLRQWIKVLLLVQVKEGEDSDAWKRALETMDLLIWSVEPRDTREARRELVAKVPDLLRRLADALAAAGIEDAVRIRFVSELRKVHSEIIAGNGGAGLTENEPVTAPVTDAVNAPAAAVPEVADPAPEASDPIAEVAATSETAEPATEPPTIELVPEIATTPEQPVPVPEPPPIEVGLSLADPLVKAEPASEEIAIAPVRVADAVPTDSLPALELPAVELAPAIEPTPEIAAKPTEPGPAFELSEIDFAPVASATPAAGIPAKLIGPAPAIELPGIEFVPATPDAAVETAADSMPELDFAAIELKPVIESEPAVPSKPVEPAPAVELPVIELAHAADAAPAVLAAPAPPLGPPVALKLPTIEKTPGAPAKPHTPAPRPGPSPKPKQPLPAKPAKPPAPAAAKPADLESLDMTAPVTVPNPFGEGQVEVADLDFTVQLRGSTGGTKPASALPPALKLGSWVEIIRKHEKEKHQTAKLTFISPLKTRYLFADRHGKTALECSQSELVRRFQLGEVTLSKEPAELALFDRIAEGVLGKLGQRR